MKIRTQEKRIKALEQMAIKLGAYYAFNLTKDVIPGYVIQTVDGQEINVNTLAGLPENAKWTDYLAFWGNRLSGTDRQAYFEFFDLEKFLTRYHAGETHLKYTYWTETATFCPMFAEQHIVFFDDEETGDIQGITFVVDCTEREKAKTVNRTLEGELKKSIGELDAERQYLELLTQDFLVVYHVNLYENTSTLIKADPKVAHYDAVKVSLRQTYEYSERIEKYRLNFVATDLRTEFKRVMTAQNLLKELESAPRYLYRYRTALGTKGQQYFEAQALRMTDTAKSGDVLLAFRCIDDVVTAEQLYQIELEERLEREQNQVELLQALGRSYHAIFRIDLENDSYTEISCVDEVRCYYDNSEPSAMRTLEALCKKIIAPRHMNRMLRFFNLNTLAKRLHDRDSIETECVTNSGSWHRAKFIVKRRNDMGDATHVLYTTQIIDDEKQYEERLIAKAEYAEDANRTKTEFISQVAHDIRTPMNSIFGFLEIAEAHMDDPERTGYCLEKIRYAGEFLQDLVNDVLDITRMEDGRLSLQPVAIELPRMLEEFAISVKNAKFDKQQDFRVDIHQMDYDWVMIDPLRLKQIYTNVLTNAIKYTPDGGRVQFTVYQEPTENPDIVQIVAIIADTGIGMSEEFMDKMFTKFERGTDTRINKIAGYGLGLSIVKQLVDLMDGTIDVQSRLGEGTTFTIRLEVPCVQGRETEATESKVDYGARCAGMHLLVAEDNALNREVITELLGMYGISCECVEDGAVCLRRIKEGTPGTYDAVLMDMQMPVMNGIEAARQIRELPTEWARKIPIFAMTANAMKDDVQRCLEAGMDRHLCKPIDVEKLLKVLAQVKDKS